MCNFTRIGPKTKKLWLSIVPVQRPSQHMGLGPPQKGVNCNFSWPELDKPYVIGKLSISEAKICSFSRIGQKIKNCSSFNFLAENLENFARRSIMVRLWRDRQFFFVAALWAYVNGKLSIT